MTKTQGTVIILLLICLLVSTTTQLMLDLLGWFDRSPWVFGGGTSMAVAVNPTLNTSLKAPKTVKLGEEFDLVVGTTNVAESPIQLYSMDVYYGLLYGFEVVSISPEGMETTTMNSGYRSWRFSETVDPGESLDITVRLKAIRVGQFSGDFDVNNSNLDYQTVVPIIRVVDEAEEDAADGQQSSRPVRRPILAEIG